METRQQEVDRFRKNLGPTTIEEFIKTIGPIALEVARNRGYGNIQVWTCITQACVESAYGTSSLMKKANAFFGIKATASWIKNAKYGGKVFRAKTRECYDGKTLTSITDCFRAYDSMIDSVEDYFDLLELRRYCKSLEVTTSVRDCIKIIKDGGYATSPTYVETIVDAFMRDKNLITSYRIPTMRCPYCGREW